jgi:exodeoxyribonuclease VII small subunit
MSAPTPKTEQREPDNFETAMEQLAQLVRELESGDVPLEKSIAAYQEGQRLIKFCQDRLTVAEQALRQIAGDAEQALGKKNGQ